MPRRQSCLFTGLVIALVTQFGVAILDEATKALVREQLTKHKYSSGQQLMLSYAFEQSNLFDRYKIIEITGSDEGQPVFKVVKDKITYAAKVIHDTSDKYLRCSREELVKGFSGKGISNINKVILVEKYSIQVFEPTFYSCVVISEVGKSDLSKKDFFNNSSLKIKQTNSMKLFRFFGKVARSIAELNFIEKVLHGNINPNTIMVEFAKKGDAIEPIISSFGLMLVGDGKTEIKSDLIRYKHGYRPPEMHFNKQMKDEEAFATHWATACLDYKYSKDFVEDVYALGKTIEYVLKEQATFIDINQCETIQLKAISAIMTKDRWQADPNNKNSFIENRPNMKKILDLFVEKTEACIINDEETKKHREFINETKSSLTTLNNKGLIV